MTSRREQILGTAAKMFAARGFHGVSIADLGAACGVSGPALYKHFASKEAILAEMLVGISEELLTEGTRRASTTSGDDTAALSALIGWHIEFAIGHPELIVVQDRDWASLPPQARERVRGLQLDYVDLWVDTLRSTRPELTKKAALAMVHACFGLLNSTPHSALLPPATMRSLLAEMARAALSA